MKVTKQNYERFLIDFMDGVLDPSLKESLFDFLDENPEIKAEFDDLEIINTAVDKDISFNLKTNLKKPQIVSIKNINEKNYEDYFISTIEADLTIMQETELKQFITLNPNLSRTYQLYKQTKVQPDLSIIYPTKNALKKHPFYQRKAWYYTASAAASVIIFISILFFNKSDDLRHTKYAQEKRLAVPESMGYISAETTINIPTKDYTINYRSITKHTFAKLVDHNIPEEKMQVLRVHNNTIEQLASLQVNFQAPLFIQQLNVQTHATFTIDSGQTNYAHVQVNRKDKGAFKVIWKGLFAQFKNRKREDEGGSDNETKHKVGSLWVLANIGLERVNEVAGTNMRIHSKIGEENNTRNDENTDLEITRSAN